MRTLILTGLLFTATSAMAACVTTDRSAPTVCSAIAFDSSYSDRAAQIANGSLSEPFTIGRPVTGVAEANPTVTLTSTSYTPPTATADTSVTLSDGSVVSTTRPIASSTTVATISTDSISTTELTAASLSTRTASEPVPTGATSSVSTAVVIAEPVVVGRAF
jgi:hypothetical protein